jgi:hypothetical protein
MHIYELLVFLYLKIENHKIDWIPNLNKYMKRTTYTINKGFLMSPSNSSL